MIHESIYKDLNDNKNRLYLITDHHIAALERTISDFQNIFLDIWTNQEIKTNQNLLEDKNAQLNI